MESSSTGSLLYVCAMCLLVAAKSSKRVSQRLLMRWASEEVGPMFHHGIKNPEDVSSFYYQDTRAAQPVQEFLSFSCPGVWALQGQNSGIFPSCLFKEELYSSCWPLFLACGPRRGETMAFGEGTYVRACFRACLSLSLFLCVCVCVCVVDVLFCSVHVSSGEVAFGWQTDT